MVPLLYVCVYTLVYAQLPSIVDGFPWPASPFAQSYSPHNFDIKRGLDAGKGAHHSRRRTASTWILDDQRMKYLVPITFGAQTLDIELDTGSSDTWLLATGYDCYHTFDNSSKTFQQLTNHSYCNSGPTYTPDSTFQPISSFYQETCYGSGHPTYRCVYGPFGYENVTLNGLSIPHAIVGAPNSSSNNLLGHITSGILGLGFPAGTRAYSTKNNSAVHYPSILSTLFNSNAIPPLFSLALSRDVANISNGGVFTIGGIPDMQDPSINVTSKQPAVTPVQYYPNVSKTEYSVYSINIDNFVLGSETLAPETPVIIDSGYNGLEIPKAVSTALNSAWRPPGVDMGTNLFLDCDATLPDFGVRIGGTTFDIKAEDLIGQMSNGTCYSLVIAGLPPNGYSLGDPLFRNTLVVFDWGAEEVMSSKDGQVQAGMGTGNASLWFWERMEYAS